MPKVELLGPKLDLPDGWRGVSFVFIAPPPAADKLKAAMPTLAAPVAFRETITVAIEPVPKGTTPLAYHEAQVRQLENAGQKVTVASKDERDHRGAPALLIELELKGPRGEKLRQIQLLAVQAGEAYAAIATTLDGPGYPTARSKLLPVLESLSF